MTPSRISTYTGRLINPLDISTPEIDIRDIAHALSNICRFNGHCAYFYSVAEHSIHVARLVEEAHPGAGLYALLHDAPEAYICDLSGPLKDTDTFTEYRAIEDDIFDRILRRFRIEPQQGWANAVHVADRMMLAIEGNQLFGNIDKWELDIKPEILRRFNFALSGWDPITAKREFMNAAINYNMSGYNGV